MTGENAGEPRTYPPGVTSWVDTDQADVPAALHFYGSLFGWSFTDAMPPDAPGRYVIAQLQGRDVGAVGSRDPDQGGAPPSWNTYIATTDVDDATRRCVELGATVLLEPVDAGPGGRTAGLRDPQGAELRLWQARRRLGAQLTNVTGAWNFSDLRTSDLDAARTFYGRAFGWVFADLGFGTAIQVPGYGDHLESTVDPDIRRRQADAPDGFEDVIGALAPLPDGESPHWHVTFTVADSDETAAQAERLGGVVLSVGSSAWTRTVTVRDPQGAVFTASQLTYGNA
jgi:predicted enzyme related to lactoylglutathione lyase